MARRYRHREKKPVNRKSLAAASAGAVCLVVFLAAFLTSLRGQRAGSALSGLGVVCMVVSLIAMIRGIREAGQEDSRGSSRAFGVILPLASFFAWLLVYIAGLVLA